MFGSFKVLSVGGNSRYCMLQLPDSWKIDPVVNIDLLKCYRGDYYKQQVVEVKADCEKWVV